MSFVQVTLESTSRAVIDSQACMVTLGKASGISTFGDLADSFVKSVLCSEHRFDRTAIACDRCRSESTKKGQKIKNENNCYFRDLKKMVTLCFQVTGRIFLRFPRQ